MCAQSCLTLCNPMDHRLLCPWDQPDKNAGVGCHLLLQGIFLTQRSNLHLLLPLPWQAGSLPLSHLGGQFADSMKSLKIPMVLFTKIEKSILKLVWNYRRHQSNLKKEEHSWRHQTSWFETILQSYSNQNSIILALKKTHRPMEEHGEPRNKSIYIQLTNIWQGSQEYSVEERQALQ